MSEYTATHRATRRNLATQPRQGSKPHPKSLRGNLKLSPEELSTAMEMAREMRTEQAIRDYAHRKRTQ
jgi:hypothetical protein